MGGYKLSIILFIALFITMSYADSFRTINNHFEPYFWEISSWRCNHALTLCWPIEILKSEYANHMALSKFDEVNVISDLSLLNDFPNAKLYITNAELELVIGRNNLEYFKRPVCIGISDIIPPGPTGFYPFNIIVESLLSCFSRGGTPGPSGCRITDGNETITLSYGVNPTCVFDYLSASSNYQNVLTRYMNALKYSIDATNDVYTQIDEEFLLLENLGAGYENYYGGAKQTYLEVDQIYEVMSFQELTGSNPNLNDISYHYSTTYQEVLEIREEMLELPNGPNFEFLNKIPIAINSLAGRQDSLILKGLILHNRIKVAQNTIILEFQELKETTEENKALANISLERLKSERLDLITIIPADYLISEIETPEDINPGDYLEWELQNMYHNLNRFNFDADQYFDEVKDYSIDGEDNLGEGIEKLTIANNMYYLTQISSAELLIEFDELASWMEIRARNKLSECNSKILNTTPTSRAFALIYKLDAEELINSPPMTIGERYDTYLNVYLNSQECIAICNGKEVYLGFDLVLNEFNRIITAAEKDDMDVSEYRNWYNFYSEYDYGPEIFPSIKADIEKYIKEIYSDAYEKYETELTTKRLEIKNNIYTMYSYDNSLLNKKLLFEKWESCFNANGSVNYKNALGKIKEILKDYDDILSSLSSKTPTVLKNRFEKEFTIRETWGKVPVMDEPTDLEIVVVFTNPTTLSYDSIVLVEIPFKYEVYNSDIISKPSEISVVSKSGDNLLIEFLKIDARQVYELKFHLTDKFFRKFSNSETIVESVTEYQKVRRVVTFDVDIPVDMLYSFEDIPPNTVGSYTELNGISKPTYTLDKQSKIELSDLSKERQVYHFYYTIENRSASQNLSQDNYQTEYDNILEEIQVLQDIVDLLNKNGLTNNSENISSNLDLVTLLLNDSQKDFDLGKYADAFDKLKQARNITQKFDLFSSLKIIREGLSNEFNQLSSVWIRSGYEDLEVKDLMGKIEDNLVKLRSLKLSKEDIPLLGETQILLDSLKTKIGSFGKSTLTELVDEIKSSKEMSNNFENIIYPKYRIYYNSLKTYKVENNLILSFPYTLTDLDSKLKTIKKSISDIEIRVDKEQNLILSDWAYISDFRESIRLFTITQNGVESIVNGVEEKTEEFISKTDASIEILQTRNLGLDGNSKLSAIKEDSKTAKEYFEKEDIVNAFKISSKAYYDSLRLLSSSNTGSGPIEGENNQFLLIVSCSIILILAIGGLFIFKGKKVTPPNEVVYTTLKRED